MEAINQTQTRQFLKSVLEVVITILKESTSTVLVQPCIPQHSQEKLSFIICLMRNIAGIA